MLFFNDHLSVKKPLINFQLIINKCLDTAVTAVKSIISYYILCDV